MALTVYYVASSVDGFIADADDRIDWLEQFGFADFQGDYDTFLAGIGALVMGSTTYEFLLNQPADQRDFLRIAAGRLRGDAVFAVHDDARRAVDAERLDQLASQL